MDSGFLNAFCDDSYINYDNDIEYWSNNNVDILGMQLLTETLDGILPIPPTENFHMDNNSNFSIHSLKKDDGISEEHFTGDGDCDGDGENAVELVTLDTQVDDYDTDNEDHVIYCHDYDDEDADDDDQYSQYSNDLFKTGSVSSSIEDYESHSSDYDNFNEVLMKNDCDGDIMKSIDDEKYKEFIPIVEGIAPIKLSRKSEDANAHAYAYHKQCSFDQFAVTTDISDAGGLGLNVDATNFDLAEFITQDDIVVNSLTSGSLTELAQMELGIKISINDKLPTNPLSKWNDKIEGTSTLSMLSNTSINSGNIIIMPSENYHSDGDSDVIVDVETVEVNEDDSILFANRVSVEDIIVGTDDEDDTENIVENFIDNIKEDPSWTPPISNACNKKSDNNGAIINQKCSRNTKDTKDIVKKKGRRRNLKNPIRNIKNVKVTSDHKKCVDKVKSKALQESKVKSCEESLNNHTESRTDNKSQSAGNYSNSLKPALKRKLNLEEYKKRRCDAYVSMNENKTSTVKSGMDKSIKIEETINVVQKGKMSHNKHSAEVASIVKSLKEEQQQQQHKLNKSKGIDPIKIAKEKVLRMQQLKKAQQLRIIDSTISAKVPKVTKLPPLKEIVQNTEYNSLIGMEIEHEHNEIQYQQKKIDAAPIRNNEYEEIITISIRCNTDISIPALPFRNAGIKLNKTTESLLKSSALLSSVSKATDNAALTKNSLIASIQDVVVKKVVYENQTKHINLKDNNKGEYNDAEHHGEDKIIMHLRKDRIRPTTCTMGVQTDFQAQFPILSILTKTLKSRPKKAYCKLNGRSRYDSLDQLAADSAEESDVSQLRHQQSREGSYSSSLERVRAYDSAIGTGYSSRGSCRNRSSISSSYSETYRSRRRQRRTSYKQRQRINSHTRSSSSSSRSSSRSRNNSNSSYTNIATTDSSDYERSYSSRQARRNRCSSSPSYSRSCSRSSTQSRSNARNSYQRHNKYKDDKSRNSNNNSTYQPAVEERRIVYVGRIEQKTTKDMLRKKFLSYGHIKHISIHYKGNGMKYGFVTYKRAQDAYAAIDNSTQDPKINMYDISFGGRRAFCRSTYADLDNAGINTYHSYVFPTNSIKRPDEQQEESFETLLMKMKQKLNAHKKLCHNKAATNI